MRSEFARFKPRKHEAVSNSGTKRDDETKIDLASLGGFVGGHGNHAYPLSPDQRHTLFSKIRPVLPAILAAAAEVGGGHPWNPWVKGVGRIAHCRDAYETT